AQSARNRDHERHPAWSCGWSDLACCWDDPPPRTGRRRQSPTTGTAHVATMTPDAICGLPRPDEAPADDPAQAAALLALLDAEATWRNLALPVPTDSPAAAHSTLSAK